LIAKRGLITITPQEIMDKRVINQSSIDVKDRRKTYE